MSKLQKKSSFLKIDVSISHLLFHHHHLKSESDRIWSHGHRRLKVYARKMRLKNSGIFGLKNGRVNLGVVVVVILLSGIECLSFRGGRKKMGRKIVWQARRRQKRTQKIQPQQVFWVAFVPRGGGGAAKPNSRACVSLLRGGGGQIKNTHFIVARWPVSRLEIGKSGIF